MTSTTAEIKSAASPRARPSSPARPRPDRDDEQRPAASAAGGGRRPGRRPGRRRGNGPAAASHGSEPSDEPTRPIISPRPRQPRSTQMGRVDVPALDDVSLDVQPGEFVAIVGPSGFGQEHDDAHPRLPRPADGRRIPARRHARRGRSTTTAWPRLRSRTIGFVFQSYNLLPRTTALDNVATPLLYQGVGAARARGAGDGRARAAGPRRPRRPRADGAVAAASSSGSPSPARSSPSPRSSSPTSRPATSTAAPAPTSWTSSASSTQRAGRSCSSPTTPRSRRAADRQIHLLDGRIAA